MRTCRLLFGGASLPAPALKLLQAEQTSTAPLAWQASGEADNWYSEIDLGPIPAGHLVVPSLILTSTRLHSYQLSFRWGDSRLQLAPIPIAGVALDDCSWQPADTGAVGSAQQQAHAGLDCMETANDLPAVTLTVTVRGASQPPELPLLVSMRPRHCQPDDPQPAATAGSCSVPPLSQMTQPDAFARHCCSPVSVAMVLGALGHSMALTDFVLSCRHPQHRMFGIWPLNLASAALQGAAGAIRTFTSATEACRVLAAGSPIVTSIRFEQGGLEGAPLARTSGHLVVLHGLDRDWAHVNDPAASPPEPVSRRYPRDAFLQAWLGDRGVGYVLWNQGYREES